MDPACFASAFKLACRVEWVHSSICSTSYDGDGNRVSETVGGTTTKFLVDSLNPTKLPQVMDETVNGSETRTYAYGLQRICSRMIRELCAECT